MSLSLSDEQWMDMVKQIENQEAMTAIRELQIKLTASEAKLAKIEEWAKADPMSSDMIIFMTTEAEAGYELAQEIVANILSGGE